MHSRLEQYLQTVEQNLHTLPAEERHNELSEIRLHMESLLEAHRELSTPEEEAVTQTLAQFGHARTLGQDLDQVHQPGGRSPFHTLVGAIAFSYLSSMLASLLVSRIVPLPLSSAPIALLIVRALPTTFCIGVLTGIVIPRYAVKGTLYAHILSFVLMVVLWAALPNTLPILSPLALVLPGTILNTSLAMLGAKLGARWRTMRLKTMRFAR